MKSKEYSKGYIEGALKELKSFKKQIKLIDHYLEKNIEFLSRKSKGESSSEEDKDYKYEAYELDGNHSGVRIMQSKHEKKLEEIKKLHGLESEGERK